MRDVVSFAITPEVPVAQQGHDLSRFANVDVRVEDADPGQFQRMLIIACQTLERANPGKLAAMKDAVTDTDGHVVGMTVTVVPG